MATYPSATPYTNPGLQRYNAIQTRTSVTVPMAKLHLRVDGDTEDELIGLYIKAVAQKADSYCQNLFLGADGVTELDIPCDVDVWILMTVAKYYELRVLGQHKAQLQDLGSTQYEKLDNFTILYEGLSPYRKIKGLGGFYFSA